MAESSIGPGTGSYRHEGSPTVVLPPAMCTSNFNRPPFCSQATRFLRLIREAVRHAFDGRPNASFLTEIGWRGSIAGVPIAEVDPVVSAKFRITKSDRVVTAGSCFAQHIARHLKENGFAYFVTETAHPLFDKHLLKDYGYGIFSARYGNIYASLFSYWNAPLDFISLKRTYGHVRTVGSSIRFDRRSRRTVSRPGRNTGPIVFSIFVQFGAPSNSLTFLSLRSGSPKVGYPGWMARLTHCARVLLAASSTRLVMRS